MHQQQKITFTNVCWETSTIEISTGTTRPPTNAKQATDRSAKARCLAFKTKIHDIRNKFLLKRLTDVPTLKITTAEYRKSQKLEILSVIRKSCICFEYCHVKGNYNSEHLLLADIKIFAQLYSQWRRTGACF